MPDDITLSTIPLKTAILDHKVEKVKNSIKSSKNAPVDQRDVKLKETCHELESLFIHYLLKEMRQTIDKSGFLSGGRAEEIYTSMLDAETANKISARGGIGLAKMLLHQLGDRTAEVKEEEPDY